MMRALSQRGLRRFVRVSKKQPKREKLREAQVRMLVTWIEELTSGK